VRGVEPLQAAAADGKLLAIAECTGGPGGKVMERCEHPDFGSKRRRFGCGRQEVVQRAKFVAFKVRSTDPTQLLDRDHLPDGFQGERE
jgi:hypothetical protein